MLGGITGLKLVHFLMNSPVRPADFQLPAGAPRRIRDFHALWLEKVGGDLPASTEFDVLDLSADYPLLVRIGVEGSSNELVWCEVASAECWPFKTPVKDRPVVESVPPLSVKRVINSFHETLESGIPDYFETTSWWHGGRTVSLARLVAPLSGAAGRELIALWEVIEPLEAA